MQETFHEFSETKTFRSKLILQRGAVNRLNDLGVVDLLRKTSQHILITDKNIENLYLKTVLAGIEASGRSVRTMVVPASESSKSFSCYARLVEDALDHTFDKHSTVISLGGGVINNLAGFLASTLYRGINLIHIPTSLLSQVDAAISFKQAINYRHGKNTIGSLYAPSCIVVDTDVLKTLPPRFLKDGLAESIKHALCHDRSLYDDIMESGKRLFDPAFLYHLVERSIHLKLQVIEGDLNQKVSDYNEAIKHYGHAVGHAVEHLMDGALYHGESIAIGMCVSSEIALIKQLCSMDCLQQHYKIFQKVGLPTSVPEELSLSDVMHKLRYDKHHLDGLTYFGLVNTVGCMEPAAHGQYGHYVDEETVKKAITNNRRRSSSHSQ
jgi:3-dehydroquinate synthase